MNPKKILLVTILALGGAALSPLHADTYQFIVSGYPAANESYPAASAGTALATATRSGGSAASQIEARYRTWDESDGIALRSDKYRRGGEQDGRLASARDTPHVITHFGADYVAGIPPNTPTWPLAPGYGTPHGRRSPEETVAKYQPAIDAGEYCMVGEFGCRNKTPHGVVLAWMEHCLKLWKSKNLGWALWNLRGHNGFLDSGRMDVAYEDFNGHKLDRKMLELLQRY